MKKHPLELWILWTGMIWAGMAGGEQLPNPDLAARALEEVTIIGARRDPQEETGAAHVIDRDELRRFMHSDIQRIARQIPGVSVQVEDGYGLRPNISIRGVSSERSSRITLLEDNVLVAPAPYSAPAAYYFPTAGRMAGFEVLKGPAAIRQGPYTIGGALNMISTPLPDGRGGSLMLEAGTDNTYRTHGHYGQQIDSGFGFLVEAHQWRSDGFQHVDRSDLDTGLNLTDYTLKLGYNPKNSRHGLELKLQLADQASNQGYLGLTDDDLAHDANRRYGLSAMDHIETLHHQAILRYDFQLSGAAGLSLTAYENRHERQWFKTEGIDLDGSESVSSFDRVGWFDIVQAVNRGEALYGVSASRLQAVLDGSADTLPGSLQLRANDRSYYSRGVQMGFNYDNDWGLATHAIEIGLRYHEDEEDRLQRNSSFQQLNGTLVMNDIGLLGNAGNQIQRARAVAFHLQDRIEIGRWVITPGIRYENIAQRRTRYETRFGRTDDPSGRSLSDVRDGRRNDTQVLLPGIGALWELDGGLSIVAGVHKGFTAPTNAPGVREETAINYELGLRYTTDRWGGEAIAFVSDYDNLLGVCTAASGSDCEAGDAFNGDAATVRGVEVVARGDLVRRGRIRIPVALTYTFIDGQFDGTVADTSFFGDVQAGDPIPYLPRHQWSLRVAVEAGRWSSDLSASYVDSVCARATCGAFEKTESSLTVDATGHYRLTEALQLYAKIENLLGDRSIVGRQPYGARPNKDRSAALGFSLAF